MYVDVKDKPRIHVYEESQGEQDLMKRSQIASEKRKLLGIVQDPRVI